MCIFEEIFRIILWKNLKPPHSSGRMRESSDIPFATKHDTVLWFPDYPYLAKELKQMNVWVSVVWYGLWVGRRSENLRWTKAAHRLSKSGLKTSEYNHPVFSEKQMRFPSLIPLFKHTHNGFWENFGMGRATREIQMACALFQLWFIRIHWPSRPNTILRNSPRENTIIYQKTSDNPHAVAWIRHHLARVRPPAISSPLLYSRGCRRPNLLNNFFGLNCF